MIFLLYFSREEKALTFAVRCWNALQLEEVEEDLHLRAHREGDQTQTCGTNVAVSLITYCRHKFYLSHDLQRPAVVHGDRLRAV